MILVSLYLCYRLLIRNRMPSFFSCVKNQIMAGLFRRFISGDEVPVRQKCSHRALALLLSNTNSSRYDCDLVTNTSEPHLTIEDGFYERAYKLTSTEIKTFEDVEKLVKKYNSSLRGQKLDILKTLHDRNPDKFIRSIRTVQSVASKYICCVPEKLPLLVQRRNGEVCLSQYQIACILANFFFFNEPYRVDRKYENDYPGIYFGRLFISDHPTDRTIRSEKLKFIFSYFDQLNEQVSNGAIAFRRQVIDDWNWENSKKNLAKIEFSVGKMEEGVQKGYCEVDFANKMIGGGVLGRGAVQEEIRFLMSPELIISRLFTQKLLANEAVVMTGAQTYSIGEGYARNFRFKNRYYDTTEVDGLNRRRSQIIAIDALRFTSYDKANEYEKRGIDRELNKALAGFQRTGDSLSDTIASGKWGCGAFNGDPYLKCLVQMMAASEADRNLVLYTFGDSRLCQEMKIVYDRLQEKNVTIGELYKYLLGYSRYGKFEQSILDFVNMKIRNTEEDNATADYSEKIQFRTGLWRGHIKNAQGPDSVGRRQRPQEVSAKPETQSNVAAELDISSGLETKADLTETKTDIKIETENQTDVNANIENKVSGIDNETETDSNIEVETEPKSEATADSEPKVESASQNVPKTEKDTENESAMDIDEYPEKDENMECDSEGESKKATETVPDNEGETSPNKPNSKY